MKSFLLTILVCLLSTTCFAQLDTSNKAQYGFGFGSLRDRYPYPITDFLYTSKMKKDFRIAVRLRSYGLASIFNGKDYDLSATMDYYKKLSPFVVLYGGLGAELMLRLNKDSRSQAENGVQPIVKIGVQATRKRFTGYLPIWTRFYSNGISFCLMPELRFQAGTRITLFGRYEQTLLQFYSYPLNEWRHDAFVGMYVRFKK